MKSVKVLKEEIQALAIEAQGIFEAANRANRDMTPDEDARFKEITRKESGGLIHELKKELAQAEERDAAIRELTNREEKKSAVEELQSLVNPTTNRSSGSILPVNGVAPDEGRLPTRVYQRMSRMKAFKNEKDAYDCGMWIRAVVSRLYNRGDDRYAEAHVKRLGWQVTNTQTEGSGPAGGYLVPAPLAQTIIDVREEVGIARRIARVIPMTSETLDIPRRESGLTVYYVGETQEITTSDKTWGLVSLIARKRAVANQISQELIDDALISIVDDAVSEMAYALADKEDEELINGDGTSTYGMVNGLINSIGSAGVIDAATGHDTWAELDLADFTLAMGSLPSKYNRNPVWIASRNFYWSTMVRIEAAASGNDIASIQGGPTSATFMGVPVYFTDKLPRTGAAATIAALFGSFEQGVIIGDRTGIRVDRSDDYAFLNDMTTLKATTRYDINVHAPGDASNVGAYVALKTAS